jgi:hypothetical protein
MWSGVTVVEVEVPEEDEGGDTGINNITIASTEGSYYLCGDYLYNSDTNRYENRSLANIYIEWSDERNAWVINNQGRYTNLGGSKKSIKTIRGLKYLMFDGLISGICEVRIVVGDNSGIFGFYGSGLSGFNYGTFIK